MFEEGLRNSFAMKGLAAWLLRNKSQVLELFVIGRMVNYCCLIKRILRRRMKCLTWVILNLLVLHLPTTYNLVSLIFIFLSLKLSCKMACFLLLSLLDSLICGLASLDSISSFSSEMIWFSVGSSPPPPAPA